MNDENSNSAAPSSYARADEIRRILDDPKYADLSGDALVPDEILEKLDGEELMALFVEQMIADKGVEPTNELRNKLLDEMSMAVSRELIAQLPDYMVAQVNKKIEEGNMTEEELSKIIDEAGVDANTVTMNAMIEYRDAYLNKEEQ